MQKLYWNNASFKDSTNFEHIKTHYYWSQTVVSILTFSLHLSIKYSPTQVNPTRVVAAGPKPNILPL